MSEIRVGENESLDNALKRFKRQCATSGVLKEVRKREHYEKPSVRRKKKSEEARRKKHRYQRGCSYVSKRETHGRPKGCYEK